MQEKGVKVLKKLLNCEKEYMACLGEAVKHIHFHVIPISKDFKDELINDGIKLSAANSVNLGRIIFQII